MAGGKETPRQRMIGMMYLVLTALLALQVSNQILQKFVLLNNGMERTSQNYAGKNQFLIKQIQQIRNSKGAAIDTLFNPAELRAMQITDLAKLCVDYINFRIKQPGGNFDNLLAGFGEWLQTKVTPKKFGNIVEYLKSPASNTEGLAAAFTAAITSGI